MNALAPTTAQKAGRLLRLLGSDADGEVLAAVRALRRLLQAAGRDLHDLAAAVEADEKPRVIYQRAPAATRTEPDFRAMAVWIRDNDKGRLQPHERKFAVDVAGELAFGGRPSEKQGAWLMALHSKLRRAS